MAQPVTLAALDRAPSGIANDAPSFATISSPARASAVIKPRIVGKQVTTKFVSQLISATLSKSGAVIEGDPKQVREITDVWTFERDIGSRDPNWKLAATEEPA